MRMRAALLLAAATFVPLAPTAAAGQEVERKPLFVLPAQPGSGYIVITAEQAPVAAAPAEGAAVLDTAAKGDVLPFDGKQGGWYFVALGGGRRGWVHGEAAALFFYPEYLFSYEPPPGWTPPNPFWVPPPGWVPPPDWVRRAPDWTPPPRWRPDWWMLWFDPRDRRWDDHRRDWDRHRGRGRDWDWDDDHDRWDRDRDRWDRDRGRGRR